MNKFVHSLAAAALALAAVPATADVITFFAPFTIEGTVAPSGTGTAWVQFDFVTHEMRFDVTWSGLSSPTTVAHVHCCTLVPLVGNAGVVVEPPTLEDFPAGVTAGHYVETIDLDEPGNVNPVFVASPSGGNGSLARAIEVLVQGLADGRGYFNIHTRTNPGGEIRARLLVGEPGGVALAGAALVLLGVARRQFSRR